jgi:3-phytase
MSKRKVNYVVSLLNNIISDLKLTITLKEEKQSKQFYSENIDSLDVYYPNDWLIVTAKETHSLLIFDKRDLTYIKSFGKKGNGNGEFYRPNGISIVGDMCFVVERDNKRIQVLQLPEFKSLCLFGDDFLKKPYGISACSGVNNGRYIIFITDNDNLDSKIYKLIYENNTFKIDKTILINNSNKLESIKYDIKNNFLFYADEMENVLYCYNLKNDRIISKSKKFENDLEGIDIYDKYVVQVEQSKHYVNQNKFHVFSRNGLNYVGNFIGGVTKNTDGIKICKDGILYAIDDDRRISSFDIREKWRDCIKKWNILNSYKGTLISLSKNPTIKPDTSFLIGTETYDYIKDLCKTINLWIKNK